MWAKLLNLLRHSDTNESWNQLRFFECTSRRSRDIYRKEYWVDIPECCLIWNWGFSCPRNCDLWHVCAHTSCGTIFDDDHRVIQHAPTPLCRDHIFRLQGMNALHPGPLEFPENSSERNTEEACRLYKVKPPSLNADLFELLLGKTDLSIALQVSLVRGWREGFMLGSNLPNKDHFVRTYVRNPDQRETLKKAMMEEKELGRLHGPVSEPYYDGRWFFNSWVSPYFVIPRTTPKGQPQRWRVIHHLSFHKSGNTELSFNGHINLEEYPTLFPTYLTGAHLIF